MPLKLMIPKSSRLFPKPEDRVRLFNAIRSRKINEFDSYWDWFLYLHICPVSRFIHWVGMVFGVYYYYHSILHAIQGGYDKAFINFIVGLIFFYFFGVFAHFLYDRGAAKSDPKYWHITLWAVIYINLSTMIGLYGRVLKKQLNKYPFIKDDWQLVEKDLIESLKQVFGII